MNDPVPCKVCGATPDVVGTPVENCDVFDYFVRCSNDACGYCPTIVDKERAIAIWNDNNSTAPAPLATARECAKKIHDRLTWYPNDNTVDVIAAIVTCYIPTASPSDAEQLIELRKTVPTEQDMTVKCLCGEKMSKVAIPRTGYDYRWVCEQADKRNYPLHVPVPQPLPERTRAQKIVAAQEYSALAAVNDELAQLRNVDYVPTDLINRQREATQQALESVAVAALIADTEQLMELRRVYEEMHVFVSAAAEQGCLRSRRVHCAENEPDSANWCLPCQAKFLILEASHEKEQRAKSV